MRRAALITLLSLCPLLATPAQAAVRYITDELTVPLRSGTSTQHRILRMLPSGSRLEVMEIDEQAGYSRVQAGNGLEGWILSRYLMATPAARDRLTAAEQRLAELQMSDKERIERMEALRNEASEKGAEVERLTRENQELSERLAAIEQTAASSLALASENKALKSKVLAIQREQLTLTQENEKLRDHTARDWFLVGSGVLILGMIIGLILPRIRVARRSSWDSL